MKELKQKKGAFWFYTTKDRDSVLGIAGYSYFEPKRGKSKFRVVSQSTIVAAGRLVCVCVCLFLLFVATVKGFN